MSTDNLGFYLVGWKKFYNKTLALIESKKTGYDAMWVFNDQVYGSIDWSIPIDTPLLELYRRRAQQLRDQYDYLVLYFSGGADSTMALHAFVDNNIFIDEIIIQDPAPVRSTVNDKDYSNLNYYSEVEYAANAHLRKYKHQLDSRTKITHQDFSKTGIELLEKDFWIENSPLCLSVSISGILRQVTQEYDRHNLNLIEKDKKIAYILGIDKPLVHFDGKDYYCYFMDTSAYHYITPINFNKTSELASNAVTEFFYWTPSMPEIVIKQAQEIKKNCELNSYAKLMASQSLKKHISEYRNILHPVIYPEHVIEKFQVDKPSTNIYRPMDNWFWQTASEKVKNNYLNAVEYLGQNIDPKHTIQHSIENGVSAHRSKFYKL
jgi:hypothetical protein